MTTNLCSSPLAEYFHLPLKDAATSLGLCPTSLKRKCRKQGIGRWPYRRLKSINHQIEELQEQLQSRGHLREKHQRKLARLQATREVILQPPQDASQTKAMIARKEEEILSRVSEQYIWHTSAVNAEGQWTESPASFEFSQGFSDELSFSSGQSSGESSPDQVTSNIFSFDSPPHEPRLPVQALSQRPASVPHLMTSANQFPFRPSYQQYPCPQASGRHSPNWDINPLPPPQNTRLPPIQDLFRSTQSPPPERRRDQEDGPPRLPSFRDFFQQ